VLTLTPSSRRARRGRAACGAGFTIIELVITLGIGAILILVAIPSLSTSMRNARLRTSAEMIENGLRTAQAEAVKQGRQTALVLTANPVVPGNFSATQLPAAVANGAYWYAVSVPYLVTTPPESFALLATGTAGQTSQGVTVTGPATVCFSSFGRLVTTSNSALVTCSAFGTIPVYGGGAQGTTPGFTYTFQTTGAALASDVPLNVTIASSGQVRLCNSNRSALSTAVTAAPDGC
jgi:type IV fimbrial biogenesis protein FimT